MARILVIDGHPDPAPERYGHALAAAYARSAVEAGHEVRGLRLATMDITILRSEHDWQEEEATDPVTRHAQGDIRWADHVAIFYPLWLGDMPALLKAFLEQVMRPGFAVAAIDRQRPARLLKGRSARIVVTMGMPALFYRLFYRAHSVKSFERNVLRFSGFAPVRRTIIGAVETGDGYRKKWINRIAELGAAGR